MKKNKNIRIGIWGYGIVGRAAVDYFLNKGYTIGVMDQRILTAQEIHYLQQKNIFFYPEKDKKTFFTIHDYIFSSSGVNIVNDYATYNYKWLHELDIFFENFNKPIIAVTGSIGKTSLMHLLSSLFKLADIKVCVGGNIGTATFDLLAQKDAVDYALLEVSSFQLQYCTKFAPHLAIWTNLYPNHLDHHVTEQEYLLAKYTILKYQKSPQAALIELSLREKIPTIIPSQLRYYYSTHKPTPIVLASIQSNERVYFLQNNTVICYANNTHIPLIALDTALLSFSFVSNIILLSAVCHILNLNQQLLYSIPTVATLPEHRLEMVATINNVDFYNDSKSTTTASTLAAVNKLCHRPLHLFIGGLSKGVNRESFILSLRNEVKRIYCFGKEAEELYEFCTTDNIPAQQFINLETAFNACLHNIQSNDIVLFSPAGSSYDLYKNYQERGKHFKNLIHDITYT